MSDEQDKEYGPNPELYAKLSRPYASKEEADHSLKGFLLAVKKLREEYNIPEVLLIGACFFDPEEGEKETVTIRAVVFGSPEFRAQMGAMAFNTYTLPEIKRADQLRNMAMSNPPKKKKGNKR